QRLDTQCDRRPLKRAMQGAVTDEVQMKIGPGGGFRAGLDEHLEPFHRHHVPDPEQRSPVRWDAKPHGGRVPIAWLESVHVDATADDMDLARGQLPFMKRSLEILT